jgi:hypothetical protein
MWAQQLEQELPKLLEGMQENADSVTGPQDTWQQVAQEAEATVGCYTARWCLQTVSGSEDDAASRLELIGGKLLAWLVDPNMDAKLSAAGYQMQQVWHELARMLHARDEAEHSSDPEAVTALVQALQAAGQALGCLATPACCNNPACCSLVGATEVHSVSGKGCICAGCRTAWYCDRACQRAHWKAHKPVCKALAAAVAATHAEA